MRKTTRGTLLALLLAAAFTVQANDTLRPEIGRPLQAAQELIKSGKYKEALSKLKEADGIAGKTPYEIFILARMRSAAASGAGDHDSAAKALEDVLAANRLSGAEQLSTYESLIGAYYRNKEYGKAVSTGQRYAKEGGNNPSIRLAVIQAQYLQNDFSGAAKELVSRVQEEERAGRVPAEDQLQLLANCYARLNDNAGYVNTLEKLLTYHPKKSYWPDMLARLQRKPGFSDRYALDVYRLSQAVGALQDAAEYMEMAQLALQSGQPAEAKKVVDEGYAKGVLGTGADASRHARLKDVVGKQLAADNQSMADSERQAKTPEVLAAVGYAYVVSGQADKGLALVERAASQTGAKRPAELRLRLGQAYRLTGNKDKAIQAFKTVDGTDGAADLARLWTIVLNRAAAD